MLSGGAVTLTAAQERREDIFTLPNAITVSRMAACPYLGYAIVQGNWGIATGVLAYAGLSDLVRASAS